MSNNLVTSNWTGTSTYTVPATDCTLNAYGIASWAVFLYSNDSNLTSVVGMSPANVPVWEMDVVSNSTYNTVSISTSFGTQISANGNTGATSATKSTMITTDGNLAYAFDNDSNGRCGTEARGGKPIANVARVHRGRHSFSPYLEMNGTAWAALGTFSLGAATLIGCIAAWFVCGPIVVTTAVASAVGGAGAAFIEARQQIQQQQQGSSPMPIVPGGGVGGVILMDPPGTTVKTIVCTSDNFGNKTCTIEYY